MGKSDPIFIVGCGRSGTTLLRLMLNKHSKIAIPEETWYYTKLDKNKEYFISKEKENWASLISDWIFENSRIHFPDLQKEKLRSYLEGLDIHNEWNKVVASLNILFSLQEEKPRWGDKTPGYVIHLPLIKSLYPSAKIIHIIRDGRDVIPSLLKHWNVGPQTNSFIETALYWKKHVSKGMEDGPKYFGKNYIEIKYEDLILDTEKELKKICSFIEEEFEPQMLNISEDAGAYIPNWEWHQQLKKPINKNHIQLWKTKMPNYEKILFYYICRDTINKLNYPKTSEHDIGAYSQWKLHQMKTMLKLTILTFKVFLYNTLKCIDKNKN